MHTEVVPSRTEGICTNLLAHDHMVCTLNTTDPDGSLIHMTHAPPKPYHRHAFFFLVTASGNFPVVYRYPT